MIRIMLTLIAMLVMALGYALWRGEAADARADKAEAKAQQAEAIADELGKVIEAERAKAAQLATIAATYEQEKQNALDRESRLRAELGTGERRLRHEIGALYTAQLSGAAAAASVDHGAAERGAELVAAAIGVGATADAQLRACQAVILADRSKP